MTDTGSVVEEPPVMASHHLEKVARGTQGLPCLCLVSDVVVVVEFDNSALTPL